MMNQISRYCVFLLFAICVPSSGYCEEMRIITSEDDQPDAGSVIVVSPDTRSARPARKRDTVNLPGTVLVGSTVLQDWSVRCALPRSISPADIAILPLDKMRKVNLKTPYGTGIPNLADLTDEAVHPSFVYAPNGWCGYKYWLAYTPYPNSNSNYENPCIAVSNDFENWMVPDGLLNPLVREPAGGFNADPHIVLNPDRSEMYLMYRERTGYNKLYLMRSADGVNWSNPLELKSGVVGVQDYASPSFWFNGSVWRCLYHNLDAVGDPVEMIETSDSNIAGEWGEPSTVTITPAPSSGWWHSSARLEPFSGNIIMLVQDATGGSNGPLSWAVSYDDGASFVRFLADTQSYYRCDFSINPVGAEHDISVIVGQVGGGNGYIYSGYADVNRKLVKNRIAAMVASMFYVANNSLGGPLAADDFNRSDRSTSLGVTINGLSWIDSSNKIGISENRAYNTNAYNCYAAVDVGIFDYTVSAVIATAGTQSWIRFREVNNNNFFRVGTYGGTVLAYQKIVNGSVANPPGTVRIGDFANGDRITVKCSGNSIKIYRNGVLRYDLLDAIHQSGTRVGIQASGAVTTYFEDFVVW